MNILLKGVTVADQASAHNHAQCDIRIEKGTITAIGKDLTGAGKEVVYAGGGIVSPGFFDLNCTSGDPGYETREDLTSVVNAAAAGGFTGIAVLPSTKPVVQTKSAVEYILNRTRNAIVDVHPIGALSSNNEGAEMVEMFDMHLAGAVAFSDGTKPIRDAGFMSRALQYAKGFGGLIMSFPENREIAGKAMINESANSVLLGMKGSPALAEELQISRDIFLATYHNCPIHISTISTAGSVKLIKKAKKDGVQITCDVAAHHLVLNETMLSGFDSNLKVKPPLRGKADAKALIEGLKDGTIDAIVSQHTPHEIEFKAVEFEIAAYGIIGLQTVLPLLIAVGLSAELITEKLAAGPRRILNLPQSQIKVGEKANIVVYEKDKKWVYTLHNNYSRSHNSPYLDTTLTGQVVLTYNNDQLKTYE